jgi:hypothetical protein
MHTDIAFAPPHGHIPLTTTPSLIVINVINVYKYSIVDDIDNYLNCGVARLYVIESFPMANPLWRFVDLEIPELDALVCEATLLPLLKSFYICT